METVLRDLRYAFRQLSRSPGFAGVAILTLALGIGANTAVFSVVNGVLLRPLPYDDPGSLVVVWPEMVTNVRTTEWLDENTGSLSAMAGLSVAEFSLAADGEEAERVLGARVSPNHFEVLRERPLLGRTFQPEESEPSRSNVVVLSHALWQARYGGDPGVVGRSVWIDYMPHTVIGVMGLDYQPLDAGYRLWIPQGVEQATTVGTDETWWVFTRVARLAPGVSIEVAQEELRAAAIRLGQQFPADIHEEQAAVATVVSLREALVGSFGRALWILLGAVGLVMLVACANVANLLLARAGVKQRDVALRTALGSSRGRVTSHLLAESAVLGVLGGVAGLALAWGTLHALKAAAPADLPRMQEVTIDSAVLLFVVAVSLLTPLLFGLVPAHRATGLDVRHLLGAGGRGIAGDPGRSRLASGLIAMEVAVSVVLVIAAALMVQTVRNLMAVDPGFRAEGVLTMQVSVPPTPGEDAAGPPNLATYRRLWDDIAAVRGVEAVGGVHILPLGPGNNRYPYWAEDNEPPTDTPAPTANIRVATPGYIQAMGIELKEGRWFADADRTETRPVIVLNESLAKRLWPNESAIGKQIRLLAEDAFAWEVVGLIGDVNQMDLGRDPSGEIYLPHEQWSWGAMYVAIRAAGRPEALAPSVTRVIRDVDPNIAIARVASMEQVVAASVASNRFLTRLMGVFGLLVIMLGAVGVYGVVAYRASRRIPEFAVRLALGSSGSDVLRTTIVQGLRPVAIGVFVGIVAASAVTRLLSSLLFEVEATDPLTYAAVAATLIVVATLAAWVPARRAMRVDPMAVLRQE